MGNNKLKMALIGFVLLVPCLLWGHGIMPSIVSEGIAPEVMPSGGGMGGGAARWAAWDEKSESGVASDSIYVAFMENVNAGGNEVGLNGSLTEAQRTLTQSGNIAGSASAMRCFDGTNDEFFATDAAANILCGQPTWTIFGKFYGVETTSGLWELSDRPTVPVQNTVEVGYVGNVPYTYIVLDGVAKLDAAPTAVPANTDTFYWVIWSDGTSVRSGWSLTKPTKSSDFAYTKRTGVTAAVQFTDGDFTRRWLGNNVDRMLNGCVSYWGVSSECLINNAL